MDAALSAHNVAAIPITSGQGRIGGFTETVGEILAHIGASLIQTSAVDVEGMAEAIDGGAEIIFLADDRRFIAVNLPLKRVVDNGEATARGYGTALELLADAQAVEDAGAFALVLEGIPRELAALITGRLRIPTVGIGAGPECDGQVLVVHDLLGLSFSPRAKFVRSYADLAAVLRDAFARFRDDVLAGRYPADAESYHWSASLREQFEKEVATRSLEDEFEG
jgi:hypothetical protein